METAETKINPNEILTKLAKLQSDVDYLKSRIESGKDKDKELKEEMKMWEEAGVEDLLRWEKEHLKNE